MIPVARPFLTLTWVTARSIAGGRVFAAIVLVVAALIPVASSLTLFSMGARAFLVRETGLGTMLLGGLLIALFAGHYRPGDDLREGVGASILVKPVGPIEYVAARLAGLAAALAAATLVWAGVLAATLAQHDAGTFDGAMILATALGVLQIVVIGALLQRLSLWVGASGTLAGGIVLYLAGHLVGALARSAARVAAPLAWPIRLLPDLGAMNVITPAALGLSIDATLGAKAVAYGCLYTAVVVVWTASAVERRGGLLR